MTVEVSNHQSCDWRAMALMVGVLVGVGVGLLFATVARQVTAPLDPRHAELAGVAGTADPL